MKTLPPEIINFHPKKWNTKVQYIKWGHIKTYKQHD